MPNSASTQPELKLCLLPAPSGEVVRIGKDEMNLIEMPWFTMWKHESAETEINERWTIEGRDGSSVECVWRVTGDPKFGLPNATALRVFLVLLEISREAGWPQVVPFTHHDLIRRLGWNRSKKYYEMLDEALTRLKAVTIDATNCWREPGIGLLKGSVKCDILNEVTVFWQSQKNKSVAKEAGRELPLSTFEWGKKFHASLVAGHLATYDLDFALGLESDVALSLYRLLNKKMYQSQVFEMDLETFYNRHLGMRPTKQPSRMKDRLKNGHQELLDKGFLERVDYAKAKGTGREKIIYVRKTWAIVGAPIEAEQTAALPVADELSPEVLRERMVTLGVKPDEKITDILQTYTAADIKLQLDCLPDRKDATAGYFISALKGGWEPPKAFTKRVEAEAQKRAQFVQAQREREEQEAAARAEQEEKEELIKFYQELTARAQTIVNNKVDIELGEAGRVQKIRKGSPAWNAALLVILRDEAFREILSENKEANLPAEDPPERPLMVPEEPEWDEMDYLPSQAPLMPDLSVYAAVVRERLASGWKFEELDGIRMQVAPLLEIDEWTEVKRLATNKTP